jgi:hypothetical protein
MPKVIAVYMKTLLKMVPGTVSRTMVNNMDILDDLCMCVCQSCQISMLLLERQYLTIQLRKRIGQS